MTNLNIKNLTTLADWLAAGAPHKHIKFNMERYVELWDEHANLVWSVENACGAACCMAGAAAQFFAPEEIKRLIDRRGEICYCSATYAIIHYIAAKSLGIDHTMANQLFTPGDMIPLDTVTPQKAAKVVYNLIRTGEVDWRVAGYPSRY